MDKIKALLDELASVVAEMEAMQEEAPAEGAEPMTEEQEASLRSLTERAGKLQDQIEFLRKVEAKSLELRAVLERAAPARVIEATVTTEETPAVEKRTVYAVPKSHGNLRAFRNAEDAYRAGMHIKGFLLGDAEARRWCYDHGVESRAQGSGTNAAGGVLVAEELSREIIRLVEEYGAFAANARRMPMTSETMLMARRKGGLTARAVGENVEVTPSDVTFDNVELVAKIWGVANRTPMSLIEDSVIDLADLMAQETAQAFAEAVDNAAFIGTGSQAYHGVTGLQVAIDDGTHTASVVTAESGEDLFADLTVTSFAKVIAKLPLYARRNAKWYIHPAGWASSMLRLSAAAGGNTKSDIAGGFAESFLGYPVVLCQPLTSALSGTTGQIACLFGDLTQSSTLGDRRAISIKTDESRYIEYDQLFTFATMRAAIVNHDLGTNSVAGPVVALKFA